MKSFLPLLSLAVVFTSCSSAYKSGQTPDDVYFSPERANGAYVRVEKNDEIKYRGEDYYSYEDDRYLRMKIRDRERWSYLDDYYRDPYAYNYYRVDLNNYYYKGYGNPRTYWNCHYNPYAPSVLVMNPGTPVYNKPRTYNLHVFDGPRDIADPKVQGYRSKDYYSPRQQSSSNRSDVGNSLRNVFGNSESSSSSRSSTPSSSSSSSNSSSGSKSSSNSSSGGSAPVRRF